MPGIYDFGIRPLNLSQDFEAGQEKARQKGLRSLMGDYYGAQDPRLGQVARMGGDAGGMQRDMQGQDDRKREQLGQFASLLAKAPVNMRPGIYKQMYPQLSQIVPDAPQDYTPDIDDMAMQIAQLYGSAKSDAPPAQQRYLEFLAAQVPEAERQDVFRNAAGTNPRARSQLYEGEGGAFNVNLGNNRATPITTGGPMPAQAPQQPASTFTLDDAALDTLRNVPPQERAAAMQAMMTGGTFAAVNGEAVPAPNQQPGVQLRKPAAAITPYQQESLDIRRQSATAAQQARDAALAARKDAAELKANQAAQATNQRQASAVETADGLTRAIDTLISNPGFAELGTELGDVKLSTPIIRSNVKDAQAQLKNIAGQVALATMSKLKALSSQGATGFGALSAQELRLLENSIATLQSEQISNPELKRSLGVIKDSMQKISAWKAPAAVGAAPAGGAPKAGAVENGYRFKGGNPADPNAWEKL